MVNQASIINPTYFEFSQGPGVQKTACTALRITRAGLKIGCDFQEIWINQVIQPFNTKDIFNFIKKCKLLNRFIKGVPAFYKIYAKMEKLNAKRSIQSGVDVICSDGLTRRRWIKQAWSVISIVAVPIILAGQLDLIKANEESGIAIHALSASVSIVHTGKVMKRLIQMQSAVEKWIRASPSDNGFKKQKNWYFYTKAALHGSRFVLQYLDLSLPNHIRAILTAVAGYIKPKEGKKIKEEKKIKAQILDINPIIEKKSVGPASRGNERILLTACQVINFALMLILLHQMFQHT